MTFFVAGLFAGLACAAFLGVLLALVTPHDDVPQESSSVVVPHWAVEDAMQRAGRGITQRHGPSES